MVATDLNDEPWREDKVLELSGLQISGRAVSNWQFVARWQMPARIFSVDGQWSQCIMYRNNDTTGLSSAAEGSLAPGMSGSPIVVNNGINGVAIGVFCVSHGSARKEGGPQPRLARDLPGWPLQEFSWHHGVGVT
jgi:hypothetical protein